MWAQWEDAGLVQRNCVLNFHRLVSRAYCERPLRGLMHSNSSASEEAIFVIKSF